MQVVYSRDVRYLHNRLKPEESYINGHRFIPHCVNTSQLATACRCEDGRSYFNCTADDREEEARVFRTTGTDTCVSDGFGGGGMKPNVAEQVADDDVILPDDYEESPTQTLRRTAERPAPATWPTASGITEQQARDACQRVMERYATYSICRQHVNLEPVITACALNIQARLYIVSLLLRRVAVLRRCGLLLQTE